jgi:hypothetical protein
MGRIFDSGHERKDIEQRKGCKKGYTAQHCQCTEVQVIRQMLRQVRLKFPDRLGLKFNLEVEADDNLNDLQGRAASGGKLPKSPGSFTQGLAA